MSASMIWLIVDGTFATIEMVVVSCFFAVVLGLPLGIMLFITRQRKMLQLPAVHRVLGFCVNVLRSVPFIILLVAIMPLTRLIVGTSIGTVASMVPLTISAIPFFARIVESSLSEVSEGLVEAALAMGATLQQIVNRVLIREAIPGLVRGATLTAITLVGYSAMAGAVGGGGLGNLAITYGYDRFEVNVMIVTVAILVVIVQLLQWGGDFIAKRLSHL